MHVKYYRRIACFLMPFALALLPACGVKPANAGESRVDSSAVEEESKNTDSGKKRETVLSVRIPQAMGQSVIGTDTVAVDISNVSDGYVMASYTGTASDCKMQITVPDGTLYTFTVPQNEYGAFPLSGGNGNYGFELIDGLG